MSLSDRDRAIVSAVARFGQLSSAHIYELIFHTSRPTCDRALLRLVRLRYLSRIERRMVGGDKGGSGQYVYQLGNRGHYELFDDRYRPSRTVNYHRIAIADAYVEFRRLEAAGRLSIAGFTTEPDCWVKVEDTELRPDLYIELVRPDGQRRHLWLEVDMGTEGQGRIKDALARYWRAYNDADANQFTAWPHVVYVTVDAERVKELLWLIGQGREEAAALFTVTKMTGLADLFG